MIKKMNRQDSWLIERWGKEKFEKVADWTDELNERADKFVRALCSPEKLAPLYNWIRETTQIPELQFREKIIDRDGKTPYIEFESNDFVHSSPILEAAYSKFYVGNFNSSCSKEQYKEGKVDEYSSRSEEVETDLSVPGKISYWMTVHYHYELLDGGSNGSEIAYVEFDENFNMKIHSSVMKYQERMEENRRFREKFGGEEDE